MVNTSERTRHPTPTTASHPTAIARRYVSKLSIYLYIGKHPDADVSVLGIYYFAS